MTEIHFYAPGEISDGLLGFAVITARFCGHWVFSRHRQRTTWEFPGGRRAPGESIDETARRELWEETGAEEVDIRRVCVYAVTKDGETKYGMLYCAEISRLGQLPSEFEMAEIMVSDKLPEHLTYPDIVPTLFEKVQAWRNLQTSADELWDVYDENRNKTGRLHRRGNPMPEGDYHLVVHVWVQNSRGEFLITKRSPNKGFPNLWECTGGSALAGDDSLTAALREVREETGLILDPDRGQMLFSRKGEDYLGDVWLFRQDFDLADVVLLPGETVDKRCADKETILKMWREGEFVPYAYLEKLMVLC